MSNLRVVRTALRKKGKSGKDKCSPRRKPRRAFSFFCEFFVNFAKERKTEKSDRKCKKTNNFYHFFRKKVLQKKYFIVMIK